jgi:hypothetical protein
VLLPFAGSILEADERLHGKLDRDAVAAIAQQLPDDWLVGGEDADGARAEYADHFARRLAAPRAFAAEAEEARRAAL